MKKVILTLSTMMTIIGTHPVFADDTHSKTVVKHTVTIICNITIPDTAKTAVRESVMAYDSIFKLGRDTLVVDPLYNKDIFCFAQSGRLFLNEELILLLDIRSLKSIVSSELFRTLEPSFITPTNHFELDSGVTVMGFCGLSLYVHIDSSENFFYPIENAAAEACAQKVCGKNYVDRNKNHMQLRIMMKELINKGWLSEQDLINAVRENNLPKVIGLILKKDPTTLTEDDVSIVCKLFDDVGFSGTYAANLRDVVKIRGEEKLYNVK